MEQGDTQGRIFSTEFQKLTCPKGRKRNLVLLAQTQSAQKKRHKFSPLRNQGQKVRPTKQARDSKSQAVILILPSPKTTAGLKDRTCGESSHGFSPWCPWNVKRGHSPENRGLKSPKSLAHSQISVTNNTGFSRRRDGDCPNPGLPIKFLLNTLPGDKICGLRP